MAQARKIKCIHVSAREDIKDKIKDNLGKGVFPVSYKEPFLVYNYGSVYQDNLIGLLLTNLCLIKEKENLYLAEELWKKGVLLPLPSRLKIHFKTTAEYMEHLIHSSRDLFILLKKHPDMMMLKDENGQTLLHHAALKYNNLGVDGASLILYLLFNAPKIDFAIQDKNGNTALHLIAANKNNSNQIFESFFTEASKHHFDFSTRNHAGHTIKDIEKILIAKVITDQYPFFKTSKKYGPSIAEVIASYVDEECELNTATEHKISKRCAIL